MLPISLNQFFRHILGFHFSLFLARSLTIIRRSSSFWFARIAIWSLFWRMIANWGGGQNIGWFRYEFFVYWLKYPSAASLDQWSLIFWGGGNLRAERADKIFCSFFLSRISIFVFYSIIICPFFSISKHISDQNLFLWDFCKNSNFLADFFLHFLILGYFFCS